MKFSAEIYTREYNAVEIKGRISYDDMDIAGTLGEEFFFCVKADDIKNEAAEYFKGDDVLMDALSKGKASIYIKNAAYDHDDYAEELHSEIEADTEEDLLDKYNDIRSEIWSKNKHTCVNFFGEGRDDYDSYWSDEELRKAAQESVDKMISSARSDD